MDVARVALYYLCSVAGFLMISGGIRLIYKQKTYVDRESHEPVEIETSLGSFKSNDMAVALFVVGFVPLIHPSHGLKDLVGSVKVDAVGIVNLLYRAEVDPTLTDRLDVPLRRRE